MKDLILDGCVLKQYTGDAMRLDLSCMREMDAVTEIAPYAFREHRELKEVILPEHLKNIGHNAFYNCRMLESVTMGPEVESAGDGAFRNCQALHRILVYYGSRTSLTLRGIRDILKSLDGAFLLDLGGNGLFIPEYLYEYEENNEARIINQITHGAGVTYRECIGTDGVDYGMYDRIFHDMAFVMQETEGIQIAWYRLLYPAQLGAEAAERYRSYLKERRKTILRELMKRQDADRLREWLSFGIYGSTEDVDEALDEAYPIGFAEGVRELLLFRRQYETEEMIL